MICDYGCGNEALYLIGNGKNCCSKSFNQCPEIRKKNSTGIKKAYKDGRKRNDHITKGKMNGWGDNRSYNNMGKSEYKYSTDEAFCIKSTASTLGLKERLIKEKIIDYKCSICKISAWFEKPIPLELDHINGNSFDNRIENLRFLCPNCHSQTPTYRGRNINSGKIKVSDNDLLIAIKEEKNIRQALIKVGLAAKGANYYRAKKLSARLETADVEPLKFGELLTCYDDDNPELNSFKNEEV